MREVSRPTRREFLGRMGLSVGAASALQSLGCGLGPGPHACSALPDGGPARTEDAMAHALLAHIDTFVVVMLENRSFDHLLGALRLDRDYVAAAQIAGLTGGESNFDPAGEIVRVARMPGDGRGTIIPQHDWRSVQKTFNGGRNDGFV